MIILGTSSNKKKKKQEEEKAPVKQKTTQTKQATQNNTQTKTNNNKKQNSKISLDELVNYAKSQPIKQTLNTGLNSIKQKGLGNTIKETVNVMKDNGVRNTLQKTSTAILQGSGMSAEGAAGVTNIGSGFVDSSIESLSPLIAPVKSAKKTVEDVKSGKTEFFKKQEVNSLQDLGKVATSSFIDLTGNALKGELQTAEGYVDSARYILSDAARGYGLDNVSDYMRKNAIQNTTGIIMGENDQYNNPTENGWLAKANEYSVLGSTLDNINQSIGQQMFRAGLQKAMGKAGMSEKAITTANNIGIFAGSYGTAKSQALMEGASEGDAIVYGVINGTAEYISERMFDAIPGFKTGESELASQMRDTVYNSVKDAFGSGAGQLALKTFNAAGEGIEEKVSAMLETAFLDFASIFNYTYGLKEGEGLNEDSALKNTWKFFNDVYNSGKAADEEALSAFFSTFIIGAATSTMTNAQKNQVVREYARDYGMTNEQAKELFEKIVDTRTELATDSKTSSADRVELQEQLTKQLAQDMNGNKLDLEELYKAMPKNKSEMQFTLNEEETKNLTQNDAELAESLMKSNFNNTEKSHNLYAIAKLVQDNNKTAKIRFINNGDLQSLGINVNTNDTTVNGFKMGDTIYINLDGAKAFETTIGHEIGEAIKAADTDSYNELKNLVKEVFTEEDLAKYEKTYTAEDGSMLTDNVEDEWVNDKLGELFESEDLRNRIAENKTLLQKVIDNVKSLINKVTGKEKEQLKTLQQQLEDKFVELYKNTDFSKGNKNTALSLDNQFKLDYNNVKETSVLRNEFLKKASANKNSFLINDYNQYHFVVKQEDGSYKIEDTIDIDGENSKKIDLYMKELKDYEVDTRRTNNNEYLEINEDQQRNNNLDITENKYTSIREEIDRFIQDYESGKYNREGINRDSEETNRRAVNNTAFSLTTNKDSQGRTLSEGQQEYFKNTTAVDEDGNLKVMYHSGKEGNYNVIDFSRTGDNTAYDNTAFGYFITDSKPFSERFKDINGEGNKGYTKEFYAIIKKPIIHPFQAWLKYSKEESDNIIRNYFTETDNLEGLQQLEEQARLNGDDSTITDIYSYLSMYEDSPFENAKQEKEILQKKGYDAVEFIEGEENYIVPNSNNDNIVSSYAIFNSNQIKNVDNTNPTDNVDIRYSLTTNKDSNGRKLTPQQQEYFKDVSPEVRDDNGNLMRFYHGGNSDNTTFDRTKGGLSNSNASVGIWFTPSKEGAKNFVDGIWYGEDANGKKTGRVVEAYLKITNPKIYETYDNTEVRNQLQEQLNEKYNQRKELTDKYSWETPSLSNVVSYMGYMDDAALLDGLTNNFHLKEETAKQYIADAKKYIELNQEYKNIERQFDDARWTDAYEQFRTDIYKLAGKTADYANTGGIGMALDNKEQYIEQYVNNLKKEGYDGIIIKNTVYDSKDFGEGNNQYVVFDSNQIKNVDNLNPTSNEDIRYSLSPVSEKINRAKQEIGTTTDLREAGYLTPDGEYLDFSGKKHGGQPGRRSMDHREIADIYTDEEYDNAESKYSNLGTATAIMQDFIDEGNIRLMPEQGIDISLEPTDAQYEQLSKYIDFVKDRNGEIYIDVDKTGTGDYGSTYYSANTPTSKIIRDIKEYFKTGTYPEQSDMSQFYSLTKNEDYANIPIKDNLTYRKDVFQQEISPIREDISNLSNQVNNLSKQIETLQNQVEIEPSEEIAPVNRGYVETYNPQTYENQEYNALNEADAETYSNALMNDEGYVRSLENMADNYVEPGSVEKKQVIKLSNQVGNELGLTSKQVIQLQDMINKYATEDYTTDEILNDLSKEFGVQSYEETNNELKEAKKVLRATPIKVSENIKNDIADYNAFRKSNMGKLNFAKDGIGVDVVYPELANGQLAGLIDPNIANPTDQLLELARLANEDVKTNMEVVVDPQQLESAADLIHEGILNSKYEEQIANFNDLENAVESEQEIAPTAIRTQESIDNFIENRDIAPIRQEQVDKQNPKNKNKITDTWRTIQETMINRNYVIDQLAKTTGNNEVKYKGDSWNNSGSEAQFDIHNYQTDINHNEVGKSVDALFEPAKQAGKYEAFNDYLVQKSNVERTNQGKGSAIPYQISTQLVQMYENENPEFKTWAKDIYKYFDNVLQAQLDSGLITQEQYDYFRGENGIYRSYVPFYPGEFVASRYFDNEGNLKTPTTLKRSKGGANSILAIEDSMIKQTYAYKQAIRQNEFFKEIVRTLGANDNGMGAELRGNPTDLDMSLFIDPETNDKYVTAYIDGEQYSSKISDELYNELNKTKENQMKELESNLSGILNPIQKVSNVRRNLLTTWNPIFLLRNGIKDIQDALINSKHTGDMLKSYFGLGEKAAILELKQAKTKEAKQFLAGYGAELYGNYDKSSKFKVVNGVMNLNELIELAPRFAEFKATLKNGGTIDEALYNAREVTTNFGRGGYVAKAMNRNGFTFLNANIQGLDKIVRNLSGENGAKGVVSVVAKGILFGIAPAVLNELAFGGAGEKDKDEEYEALPDYVKDNYYLIKTENGTFVRIPKGRALSVMGSAARRAIEAAEGEENAFEGWAKNAWSQIGVGDSGGLQTIFTPITQAVKNEAWYGGDIVPTRLQNLPAEEQYDEKTDAISKKIGEIFKVSPKKVNYVIDQYSGGIGDLLLPTITPATSNGAEGIGYAVAPLKDAFVVNSTDDNKYPSEFYTLKDKLQVQSNSQNATDEDKLRYKYLNAVNGELAELYKERREVQADTTLSKSEKYTKVQKIQDEINSLAKEGVANSKIVSQTDNYATVGDREYYINDEGEWTKLNDNDLLDTAGMTGSEKGTYFKAKSKISEYTKEYKDLTKDLDKNTDAKLIEQYASEKKQKIMQTVINSGLSNEDKAILYANYYSNSDTMANVVNAGYDVDTYITAINDIEELRTKYSQKNGYSTAYRKKLTQAYINSLNMSDVQKAMMFRQYYSSYDGYNKQILKYVQSLNISNEEKLAILKQCKFEVKQKNGQTIISW